MMHRKQRKLRSEMTPYEGRAKRWCRKMFASDEARMELPESKSERSLISTRVVCGVLFGLLFITMGRASHQPASEYVGWVGMVLLATWAVLCGMASTWEREYLYKKREHLRAKNAADQADYNASIKAGKKVFNDCVNYSADDREATHKLMRNLQKMRTVGDKKFDKAVQKEFFGKSDDTP